MPWDRCPRAPGARGSRKQWWLLSRLGAFAHCAAPRPPNYNIGKKEKEKSAAMCGTCRLGSARIFCFPNIIIRGAGGRVLPAHPLNIVIRGRGGASALRWNAASGQVHGGRARRARGGAGCLAIQRGAGAASGPALTALKGFMWPLGAARSDSPFSSLKRRSELLPRLVFAFRWPNLLGARFATRNGAGVPKLGRQSPKKKPKADELAAQPLLPEKARSETKMSAQKRKNLSSK